MIIVNASFLLTSYHLVSSLLMKLWWALKADLDGRLLSKGILLLLAIRCIQWLVMVISLTSIYKGKGGYTRAQGVIHHTVVNLVTRWSREHRILFFDNLYTSPALCRHLLSIGIYSCGTV